MGRSGGKSMDKPLKIKFILISIILMILTFVTMKKSIKSDSMKPHGKLFISDYLPSLNGFPDASGRVQSFL